MATSKVTYLGDLRTSSIHLASGSEIISDAPIDNNGKGGAFSPTDTVANALASCMFTVMGIKAQDLAVDFSNSTAEVTKIMGTEPRRIAQIHVTFKMNVSVSDKEDGSLANKKVAEEDVMVSVNFLDGYDKTIIAQGHQANIS